MKRLWNSFIKSYEEDSAAYNLGCIIIIIAFCFCGGGVWAIIAIIKAIKG